MSRRLAVGVGIVVVIIGVVVLREQTMTRDEPGVAGTATEVVVRATTRNAEPTTTNAELTAALVSTCRVEVKAEPVSDLERVSAEDHRYRLVLAPALDEFDQRQLHGCLEDAAINHLQVKVVALRQLEWPES
jgi:zona occludens toxin (predicted ATPase)